MEKNYDDKEIDRKIRKYNQAYVQVMVMLVAVLYLVFSAISWDFNVGEWHPITRGVYIVLFIGGWILFGHAVSDLKKTAREPRDIHNAVESALKEASENIKQSQTKSKFQERLEQLAKERKNPQDN